MICMLESRIDRADLRCRRCVGVGGGRGGTALPGGRRRGRGVRQYSVRGRRGEGRRLGRGVTCHKSPCMRSVYMCYLPCCMIRSPPCMIVTCLVRRRSRGRGVGSGCRVLCVWIKRCRWRGRSLKWIALLSGRPGLIRGVTRGVWGGVRRLARGGVGGSGLVKWVGSTHRSRGGVGIHSRPSWSSKNCAGGS